MYVVCVCLYSVFLCDGLRVNLQGMLNFTVVQATNAQRVSEV